jgi:hypothetical protein
MRFDCREVGEAGIELDLISRRAEPEYRVFAERITAGLAEYERILADADRAGVAGARRGNGPPQDLVPFGGSRNLPFPPATNPAAVSGTWALLRRAASSAQSFGR